MVVGDRDGAAKPDLATARFEANDVGVFLNGVP
jgi:hypothetical protein